MYIAAATALANENIIPMLPPNSGPKDLDNKKYAPPEMRIAHFAWKLNKIFPGDFFFLDSNKACRHSYLVERKFISNVNKLFLEENEKVDHKKCKTNVNKFN